MPEPALFQSASVCLTLSPSLPFRSSGEVKVPFPPTNVHACEVSDNYVVLSWDEPEPRGREPLTFYVERVSPHFLTAHFNDIRLIPFLTHTLLTHYINTGSVWEQFITFSSKKSKISADHVQITL